MIKLISSLLVELEFVKEREREVCKVVIFEWWRYEIVYMVDWIHVFCLTLGCFVYRIDYGT